MTTSKTVNSSTSPTNHVRAVALYGEPVAKAAQEFLDLKARRANPDGKFDSAGRWYPDQEYSCCSVRSPSRAYPYSLLVHCRTAQHVAAARGVALSELKAAARLIAGPAAAPKREGGDNYYKAVAVRPDGTMISIYDGSTVYAIGVTLNGQARRDHEGGYYCYRSAEEAQAVVVPESSAAADLPRRILRVRAEGNYCVYGNGKLAFSKITPLAIVE